MGVAVLGGMLCATALSLVLVPAVYVWSAAWGPAKSPA